MVSVVNPAPKPTTNTSANVAKSETPVSANTIVNLRTTPGGTKITQLTLGSRGVIDTSVPAVFKDGYTWVYVRFGSQVGYVAKEFLKTESVNTATIPGNTLDAATLAKIQELLKMIEFLRAQLLILQQKGQ